MNIYETPDYKLERSMSEIEDAVEKTAESYNMLVSAIKAGASPYDGADFLVLAGEAMRKALYELMTAMDCIASVYRAIPKEKGTGERNEETEV